MKLNINFEDINQIIVGAFVVATPVSFSQEAWDMAYTLPTANLILIVLLSLFFISIYAYQNVFQGQVSYRYLSLFVRIFIAYSVTLLVVALLLFAINKFPLSTEPILTLKRLIVIAMPASMGAIIVDSFDKE